MLKYIKSHFEEIFLYLTITPLLIVDFFPGIFPFTSFDKKLYLYLFLGLILLSLLLRRSKTTKFNLTHRLIFLLYPLALLLVLSLLGGVSSSGISLSHPVLWLLVLVELFRIYKERRSSELKLADKNVKSD